MYWLEQIPGDPDWVWLALEGSQWVPPVLPGAKIALLGNIDCATCDQQGVSGTMFSFNYNGGSGLQLSNTDYSMYVF